MKCAIIGAGQLGSRHLQSLLTISSHHLFIFVVDPVRESIETAKQRSEEITHSHELVFTHNMFDLPNYLDFVVIATNSLVRLSVLQQLTLQSKVKYLLLEKVLFPEIKQYEIALELVKENSIKCWVNHPRRMFDCYKKLKQHFDATKNYSMQISGSSWGLACNALHFIDFFEYLTDKPLTSLSLNLVNGHPIESKRNGYLEFEGEILGVLGEKNSFSINSFSGNKPVAPSISIMTDNFRVLIQESGSPAIYFLESSNNFQLVADTLTVEYQSQLTSKLFNQLILTGECDLPKLSHASKTHQIFIQAFLDHWNNHSGKNRFILPIT